MPFVDRDGVRIHYEVAGDGPAVLLTHGFASAAQAWEGQAAALSDTYRVITWDLRGHGESGSPEDATAYSVEATVADMAAVLDACEAPEAALVGHSLGGYMCLSFYLDHPERVRAIALSDTGPGYRNDEAREAWNERARRSGDRLDERGMVGMRESNEVHHAWHPHGAAGLAHAARGMMTQRDGRVLSALPEVAVPALVIVGAEDEPYLAGADYMANKIPNVTKVVVPDSGHSPNLEQPAAFNAALRAFLDGALG
ncbi:MAG: alpha/beta fold hydrolase [Dehalococcoidia bacterium]